MRAHLPEPAVFRPPMRATGGALLLGATAGSVVGALAGVPAIVAAAFGAVAAAIALAARHARGLRVAADEQGLRVLGGVTVEAAWPDLRLGFGLTQRDDGTVQRYAIIADPRGRSLAFADTGGRRCGLVQGADGGMVEVVELRDAALLLGVVVQRAGAWGAFPESLRGTDGGGARSAGGASTPGPAVPTLSANGGTPGRAVPTLGANGGTPGPAVPTLGANGGTPGPAVPTLSANRSTPAPAIPAIGAGGGTRRAAPRRAGAGLLGLVAKLGTKVLAAVGKVGTGALKAAKTANVGWAIASAAAYSVLFSWQFAVAIMVQLFVHEYGHVHAMRRTGMKVRGMYFIPFLGAIAVTEDSFTSRRQQAYVALNGPLWGSLLSVIPVGLWLWTDEPLWAAIAAWWALINLFNLLPIAPLDGGRVLQAFAFSYSSSLGLALSLLGLAGAVALGTAFGFSIIWLVAALGAMELVVESQVHAGARALRLLPDAPRFSAPHWLFLRGAVAAVGPSAHAAEVMFLRTLERQERAARAEPLRKWQLVRWGLAYAALALVLVALVWGMRHVPGADMASRILE